MNIQDKARFFGEMKRVVKPGGRVAIYDPIGGNGDPLTFPVPWSRDGEISFLINTEETQAILADAGFDIVEWRDVSQRSLDWFQQQAASGAPPSPLNLSLILGGEWGTMAANMVRNIAEGRLAVVQVVAQRRD
jgi:SAM-dependent methyltransferase